MQRSSTLNWLNPHDSRKRSIDDWLRDPLSSSEARDLLDLLDERYRTASCLFATQLPIHQWHQHIHDPTLADAMLDRVVHDVKWTRRVGQFFRKNKL